MIAAEAQKYFTLRLESGLITDGVFRYVRHPNYLGEMMIYGSFALMSGIGCRSLCWLGSGADYSP